MMPVPEWCGKYTIRPYEEAERKGRRRFCWELTREILADEFGRHLPAYESWGQEDVTIEVARDVAGLQSWEKVEALKAEPGDVLWFTNANGSLHVGVYVGNKQMIHATQEGGVTIARVDKQPWAARLNGYYRWVGE